jgi:hypothetical protein
VFSFAFNYYLSKINRPINQYTKVLHMIGWSKMNERLPDTTLLGKLKKQKDTTSISF